MSGLSGLIGLHPLTRSCIHQHFPSGYTNIYCGRGPKFDAPLGPRELPRPYPGTRGWTT